jgi:small conductance mechanosensitive channel
VVLSLQDVVDQVARFFHLESGVLLQKGVQIGLIWIGAWAFILGVRFLARRILRAVDDGDDSTLTAREKRGQTVAQLLRSVGRIVAVIAAVVFTLDVFIDVTPILAGAGIMGLAISFGAQSLVKDILSGFFILLEGQFAVGDIIEVAGKSGVVERMTMRVVQIRDLEGVLHTVPNGEITTVSNKTRGWSRALLEIGVAYGEKVDDVLHVFADEAKRMAADPHWALRLDGDPEVAGVTDLGDSSVVVRTLLRTVPGAQWEVGREFRRRIKNRLDAEGMEIPFPQRTLHLRVDDPRIVEALPRGGGED